MVEIDTTLVGQALEEVLHGHSFSSSKQCQALLRYIVRHTLDDQGSMLRERVIGAEVFGRPPDYDTGNDPVVRSRAAEVRKRLAQHYMHPGETRSDIRIDIPSGSYRATFDLLEPPSVPRETSRAPDEEVTPTRVHEPAAELSFSAREDVSCAPAPSEPSARPARRWPARKLGLLVLAGLLVLVALISAVRLWPIRGEAELPFDRFWGPFTNSSQRAIVYFGGSYTYHLSSQFLADYRSAHHLPSDGPELIQDIENGSMLNERSLIPSNPMIGYGDVAAVARIASTLTRLGKRYDLRYGSDLTVTDLRASPTIFIGGFSNAWTLQLTREFRYSLGQGGIVDRQQHKLVWKQSASPDGVRNDDYAVISRIPDSPLGSSTLFIAGINTYSNQAAADFLSDPGRIREVTHSLGKGWEKRNLQIVLHTSVINQVPVAADVVAVSTW